MKKALLLPILFILCITLAEASIASLNVSWQLSSSTLKPSSIATIFLTFSNPSVDLTDVVMNATSGPYVKILSGYKIELGGLVSASSSQGAISIEVDDNAPSTTSYVSLDIFYYTGVSSYEKTLTIPIQIIRDPSLQIENVKFSSDLEPGKSLNLTFDLKNEGIGDAKDVTISIDHTSDFIVPQSSGEIFIDNIEASESKALIFPLTVSPSASIGTSTIPVNLSYYDETRTNLYKEANEIGTTITGTYNFILTVDSQDVIAQGTTGSITIKISNAGSQQAKYLTVKVLPSNNFDLSPTTIYIGNLNSDDYDSEKLMLAANSQQGSYPINLQLNYQDDFGKAYSEVFSVNAKISSKSEYSSANQTQSPLPIILVVIIVIIFVFVLYKKGYLKRK